jgi:putative hydrolase of the HAD superfamily
VFLSSCYLGIRKPGEEVYRLALDITQRHPEECLFIDDPAVDVECADRVEVPPIQFHDPAQLKDDLELRGVTV